MMTPSDKTEAIDLLDTAEEKLSEAIDALCQLERHLRHVGIKGIAGRLRAYTIGHLESFLGQDEGNYGKQIGSITDVREDLNDYEVASEDADE